MSLGAIGGYGYDPYFMAAYQSYNPNFQGASQSTGTTQTTQQQGLTTSEPTFRAKKKEEKSSGSAAKLIVGGALAIGTGVMLYKAHKKGGEKGIVEGFKQMWKGITGKGGQTASAKPKTFSYQEINGAQTVTIPNRTNIIRENQLGKLNSVGSDKAIVEIIDTTTNKLSKGVRLNKGTYCDDNLKLVFKDGKVVKYEVKTDDKWVDMLSKYKNPIEADDITNQKRINEVLAKFQKGEDIDKFTDIRYTHTENGVTKVFTKANKDANAELKYAFANRFNIADDAVEAYRLDNNNADKALKALAEGKDDGWKIAKADYVSPTHGTFHIENGKITGLTIDGTKYSVDSDKYKSLYKNNKEAFDNVLKVKNDELTNIVRELA